VPPCTATAWLSPDSTVTACWWATRTAWSHAAANRGLATSSPTFSRTKLVVAAAIVGVRACSRCTS
jgi:hypothetical protein